MQLLSLKINYVSCFYFALLCTSLSKMPGYDEVGKVAMLNSDRCVLVFVGFYAGECVWFVLKNERMVALFFQ